jgi:hypothetical protein
MNSVARGIAHGLAIVLFDEMRPWTTSSIDWLSSGEPATSVIRSYKLHGSKTRQQPHTPRLRVDVSTILTLLNLGAKTLRAPTYRTSAESPPF